MSAAPPGDVMPCRSCKAPIRWERTRKGKLVPVDVDTGVSHYRTCNQPDRAARAGLHLRGMPG